MELYRVTIPKDDAWRVVETLGDMNAAHFINMNRDVQIQNLPYGARISLCDNAERRLLFLLDACKKMRVPIQKPESITKFAELVTDIGKDLNTGIHLLFDRVEEETRKAEAFVAGQQKNIDEIQTNLNTLKDSLKVYKFVRQMF